MGRIMHGDESARCALLSQIELEVYREGHRVIAGVDEAGRGPLAGPVVASAVVLPRGCVIEEINDSKLLTEAQRERVYWRILDNALDVSIALSPPRVIDEINILQATWRAMREALDGLSPAPHFVLVDGWPIPGIENQRGVIDGDRKSISIAAASIIAKVTRDRIMKQLNSFWPVYGFVRHKGYGTPEHLAAIKAHGICPIHRRSFGPVAQQLLPLGDDPDG